VLTDRQKRKADIREARLCLARARVELSRASGLLDDRQPGAPQLPEYYEINRAFWAVDEVEKKVAKIGKTGGSIPATAEDEGAKNPTSEGQASADPPLLNKSGGSDVDGR
jgi:predicted enzyme related to lactoylglutathione lyase